MQWCETLVIFDCDGVLVDSERLAEEVTLAEIRKIHPEMSLEDFRHAFLGRSDAEALTNFEKIIGKKLSPQWNDQRREKEHHLFREKLQPVPGIKQAIAAIENRGAQTCVASSGPFSKMEITLGKVDLWDHFHNRIFSATQVLRGKPAPDLFEFAATQMGFSPKHCVVVEDTRNGVCAALAARMRVIAYTGSTTPANWLSQASAQIDDMVNLPDAIDRVCKIIQ